MPIHCTSTTCTFFPYQHLPGNLHVRTVTGNPLFQGVPRGTFPHKWHTVWGLHGRSTRTQHILPIYSFRAYSLGILGVRLCPVGRLAGGCERGVEVWREGQGEGSAPLSS